ncbi:hypothetical protein L596_008653 [Steinernema carpocapsae]|uniref:Uncharacterized protein n=1 Tax=Steinernema carpocapsae TaxID=34508 RepID=A0A4U5PDE3_STECR|nr:hypothetical protein L596_008653 [Steinernema carpocapsae]
MCLVERGNVWEESFCGAASRGIGWSQIHEGTRARELLDLASFVCNNLTKKTEFLEKAWTAERPVTGHLI